MIEGSIPKETVVEDIVKIYMTIELSCTHEFKDSILTLLDNLIDKILEDRQCLEVQKTTSYVDTVKGLMNVSEG